MGAPADSVFRDEQFQNNAPDRVDTHYWHRARNRIVERLLGPRSALGDGLALEIGCGRGVVVSYLRRRGWPVWGVELGQPAPLDDAVAPYLHLGRDACALPGEFRAQVRILLLLDLLEHLADPASFLQSCTAAFPACQHLVVTLPACAELFSNYDTYYGHHLRYDRRTLEALAAGAALSVVRWEYFFHLLYLPARLLAALGVPRSVVMTPPRGPALRLAHRGLGALLAAECHLVPARVRGTSLAAVLRPRSAP
jgi:hypothetical protein